MEYDRKLINDERVKIRVVSSMEPHPMSPYGDEDFGYQTIKNSIRQIWGNATVVPGIIIYNIYSKLIFIIVITPYTMYC